MYCLGNSVQHLPSTTTALNESLRAPWIVLTQ